MVMSGVATACATAGAEPGGYSPSQNDSIWIARTKARVLARDDAAEACGWPAAPTFDFMDERGGDALPVNRSLFLDLMQWLRSDQNARAVYEAYGDESSRDRVRSVDAINLVKIKEVFSAGMPGLSDVGYQGGNAALILAIHADADPAFQKEAYLKIEEAAKQGGIPKNFPLIFKSVRSHVVASNSNGSEPTRAPSAVQSKEVCFQHRYTDFFNERLRGLLPKSVHE